MDDEIIDVELTGSDRAALETALARVLGRITDESPADAREDAVTAVPLSGRGATMPAVFADLVDDLLAALETHGGGLTTARLDGVLATDDGNWRAWGYLHGVLNQPRTARFERVTEPGPDAAGRVRLRRATG